MQSVIHDLKYRGNKQLAFEMGVLLGKKILEHNCDLPDVIIPIPLHKKRKRQRGYNQAGIIAKGISSVIGVDVEENLLIRSNYTNTQTKKTREERKRNLRNAFSLNERLISRYNGNHFMIVDDVFTTGATICSGMEAFTAKIKGEFSVACLAYTGEPWDWECSYLKSLAFLP
ncbi:MAG: ComF family protein [Bacteroidales bacterium]